MDLSNQNKNINNVEVDSPTLCANNETPPRILFSDGDSVDDRINFWRHINRTRNTKKQK